MNHKISPVQNLNALLEQLYLARIALEKASVLLPTDELDRLDEAQEHITALIDNVKIDFSQVPRP